MISSKTSNLLLLMTTMVITINATFGKETITARGTQGLRGGRTPKSDDAPQQHNDPRALQEERLEASHFKSLDVYKDDQPNLFSHGEAGIMFDIFAKKNGVSITGFKVHYGYYDSVEDLNVWIYTRNSSYVGYEYTEEDWVLVFNSTMDVQEGDTVSLSLSDAIDMSACDTQAFYIGDSEGNVYIDNLNEGELYVVESDEIAYQGGAKNDGPFDYIEHVESRLRYSSGSFRGIVSYEWNDGAGANDEEVCAFTAAPTSVPSASPSDSPTFPAVPSAPPSASPTSFLEYLVADDSISKRIKCHYEATGNSVSKDYLGRNNDGQSSKSPGTTTFFGYGGPTLAYASEWASLKWTFEDAGTNNGQFYIKSEWETSSGYLGREMDSNTGEAVGEKVAFYAKMSDYTGQLWSLEEAEEGGGLYRFVNAYDSSSGFLTKCSDCTGSVRLIGKEDWKVQKWEVFDSDYSNYSS